MCLDTLGQSASKAGIVKFSFEGKSRYRQVERYLVIMAPLSNEAGDDALDNLYLPSIVHHPN